MGRFYNIQVGSTVYSSQYNGLDNPGALDIEFDIYEQTYGIPASGGGSTLTIHGVPLADLQQSQNFAGQLLTMSAGMSPGYPLVNPNQQGIILNGQVLQSFGNWIGTEMTLDFVVYPAAFTQVSNPGNFVFNWQKGVTLQAALTQAFSAAYSGVTPAPTYSFVLNGTYAPQPNGHLTQYTTLGSLAAYIKSITKLGSPDGNGVSIGYQNAANVIAVYDSGGTSAATPIQINFTDLVGQPTYVDVNMIQITLVLRADLGVGTFITLPPGLPYAPGTVATAGSAFGQGISGPQQLQYQSTFQGSFLVQSLRHVGNLRDPQGTSWVTVVTCSPAGSTPAATDSGS